MVQRLFYGDDDAQFGDLRVPEGSGPFPCIVLIHGGFWRARYALDLMDDMAKDFCCRGYVTWNIEYRRVGQRGGGWPGTVLDVANAMDYLGDLTTSGVPIDLERIGVVGHSAGGHLALWLGTRHRKSLYGNVLPQRTPISPTAIVALAGVSDLPAMHEARPIESPVQAFMGGLPSEIADAYDEASPMANLPLGIPQVLVHGTADDSVPYNQSVRYVEAAQQQGDFARLLSFEAVDHFAIINPSSRVWPTIVQCVSSLIPPSMLS